MQPKFSIITVCLNSDKTIRKTIESVLNQSYKGAEYIIVDGISKDKTLEIINEYEEYINTFVSEKDKGIYDAWNKGVRLATGEYITILNADDWIDSDFLTSVNVLLTEQPGLDFVYGGVKAVYPNGKTVPVRCDTINMNKIIGMPFPLAGLVLKRELFIKNGFFDTSYKYAADLDWILRMLFSGFTGQSTKKIEASYLIGGEGNSLRSLKEATIVLSKYNKSFLFSKRYYLSTLARLYLGKMYSYFFGLNKFK
jgi:glycosyltransferase involved in cell wall biosynthesis